MAVGRETLYNEVWAEPMTKVAARYSVSSSFLARVCERLNVPHPARGHWAQLKVGKMNPTPALPEARAGDELEWSRDGEPRRVPRALPQPPVKRSHTKRASRRDRPSRHELLAGAREHYERFRQSDSGYLRPFKRRLVDVFVTKATLEYALDVANSLFLALEDRKHHVTLAPLGQGLRRSDVDERREGGHERYGHGSWSPDRPTVVYVGTVAIGLTLFELSEEVEVRYVDGTYVRVADTPPPAQRRRRWTRPEDVWTNKRDMPSGRLSLRASSPYARVAWERQWREGEQQELSAKVPRIVRDLEADAVTIAALVAESERLAEIERKQWAAQQEKWRADEAERRRLQNTKESREELFAIIEAWGVAKQVEGFFEDAERRAAGLDDTNAVLDRLSRARALIGDVDALRRFCAWRAPEER